MVNGIIPSFQEILKIVYFNSLQALKSEYVFIHLI